MRSLACAALYAAMLGACTESPLSTSEPAVEPQFILSGFVVSSTAFAQDWPFTAAIFVHSGQLSFFCSGSVIGDRWVVTAAHCVDEARRQVQLGRTIFVGVGSRDMLQGMRFLQADQFFTAPLYNPLSVPVNDVGLMRLTSDAGVAAARLPTASAEGIASIRIAGWGDTGAGISTTLRTTTLSVIDFDDTALFAATSGTAVCGGDSGGPNLDSDGTLIAVNSLSSSGVCSDPDAISGHAPLFVQVPWITTVTGITPPSVDQTGPVATNVVVEPVAVNATGPLHARIDDLATGNSAIGAAFLQVGAESPIPMTALDGAFDEPVEDVAASFVAPASAGLHTACVDGSDEHGNVGQPVCTLVAIYDPAGGFATGAGWIDSGDPLAGHAFFAFVSRYRRGATQPDGNTQFRFQDGSIDFRSTSYDWLVVKANGEAHFKGSGTLADVPGDHRFMLWARDDAGGDTFRIRIWNADDESDVVYDNGTDQPLLAGSIIVHR